MKKAHSKFRLLVLSFGLFVFFQFLTGAFIYFTKVGFGYDSTLAYYKGTMKAQEILGYKISGKFFQGRSLYGLVEINTAHAAAYGIICFVLAHFLRSLTSNALWTNRLSIGLFCFAILEILSTFGACYGPHYFALLRLVSLYGFLTLGFFSSLALLILPCQNQDS